MTVELLLPVLLVFRRTRVAALFIGGAFHLLLGLNWNYDFSAVVLPFYALFVPEELWPEIHGLGDRSPRIAAMKKSVARLANWRGTFPLLIAVVLAGLGLVHAAGVTPRQLHTHSMRAGMATWLAVTAVAYLALIAALRRNVEPPSRLSTLRLPSRVALVGPVLVVLSGIAPYLGLNTERAFTMFSNLRTEGEEWNHYLMPRSLRLFAFQDELYRIVASSDAGLSEIANRGESLVPFELRRRLSANPSAAVTYVAGGLQRQVADARDDPDLAVPVDPLLGRLLWFRAVAPRPDCAH